MALSIAARGESPLRLCYEDVPDRPWTAPDGTGLNLDLLRMVAARLGESFEFQAKPWVRCLAELNAGTVDGIVGANDVPERHAIGMFPTLANGDTDTHAALYDGHYSVFLRVGSGATWDGQTLKALHGPVVVQRGYSAAGALRRMGHEVSEVAKSPEDGIRIVAQGSADVAIVYSPGAESPIAAAHSAGKVVMAPQPFLQGWLYLVFGKPLFAAQRARCERIWSTIASVRASPAYRSLEATTQQEAHREPPPNTVPP